MKNSNKNWKCAHVVLLSKFYGVLTLIQPNNRKRELHKRQEHDIGLVVPRADPTKRFDPPEQALNHVPFLVRFFVILPRVGPVRLRRDYRFMSVGPRQFAGLVALVRLVHQQRHALIVPADGLYGFPSLGGVVALPARQVHLDDNLIIRGYHMKLGVPAAL